MSVPNGDSFVIRATVHELFLNGKQLPKTGNCLFKTLNKYYELPAGVKEFTITAEKNAVVEISYTCNLQRKI